MKKILIVLLSSILVGLTVNVQAASVSFDPGSVEFQVAPGQTDKANLRVNAFSSGAYSLFIRVGSWVENGNLPASWLNPVMASLASRSGGNASTAIDLAISVPPDAMAGIYSGLLMPEVMRSSEPVTSRGLLVVIEVAPQNACSIPPVFENVEIGPQEIWAPSDRDVEIEISGVLSVADGCEITAGYSLESNTGLIQGDITLEPDGSFSEKFLANVSRSGRDKDGRVYNGTLFAVDVDGNLANLEFNVTVLHDKGKKTGQNK